MRGRRQGFGWDQEHQEEEQQQQEGEGQEAYLWVVVVLVVVVGRRVWVLQVLPRSSSSQGVGAGSSSLQGLVLQLMQPWQQCSQVSNSSSSSRVVQ
jgi:hypothetical protein